MLGLGRVAQQREKWGEGLMQDEPYVATSLV